MKPIEPDTPSEASVSTPWEHASTTCWKHVKTATRMIELLNTLKSVRIATVVPVMSDTSPCLLVSPEHSDDVTEIRALCRLISSILGVPTWLHLNIADQWYFRLRLDDGVYIDVVSSLPASRENPVQL